MNTHVVLSLFHLFLIVPLFLFIGFQRADTPQWVYYAIATMGVVVFFFHAVKLFLRLQTNSPYMWVNAIHAIFIAPLLLYIGYHQKDTPRAAYELLLLLGFGAFGYHTYSLVKMLQTVDTNHSA